MVAPAGAMSANPPTISAMPATPQAAPVRVDCRPYGMPAGAGGGVGDDTVWVLTGPPSDEPRGMRGDSPHRRAPGGPCREAAFPARPGDPPGPDRPPVAENDRMRCTGLRRCRGGSQADRPRRRLLP